MVIQPIGGGGKTNIKVFSLKSSALGGARVTSALLLFFSVQIFQFQCRLSWFYIIPTMPTPVFMCFVLFFPLEISMPRKKENKIVNKEKHYILEYSNPQCQDLPSECGFLQLFYLYLP